MNESASTNTPTVTRLEVGQPAPDFTLSDDQGNAVRLSDLLSNDVPGDGTRGDDSGSGARRDASRHRVILYFYPAAMTPGCTTEACDFRDRLDRLASAGYTVVGVSKDLPDKLARFRERDHLTFTLLSDPDLAVHKAYGAYGERKLYGKVHVGPIRSTFVIGAAADDEDLPDGLAPADAARARHERERARHERERRERPWRNWRDRTGAVQRARQGTRRFAAQAAGQAGLTDRSAHAHE